MFESKGLMCLLATYTIFEQKYLDLSKSIKVNGSLIFLVPLVLENPYDLTDSILFSDTIVCPQRDMP